MTLCEGKSLYNKVCIYSKKFRIGLTIKKKKNRPSSSGLTIFHSNDNTKKKVFTFFGKPCTMILKEVKK